MNVHKRNFIPKEKRTLGVSGVDKLGETVAQFPSVGYLFLVVLFLEESIEIWNYMTIDLWTISIWSSSIDD